MGKYRALLLFFIGTTIGGFINYFIFRDLEGVMMATLVIYTIIIFVLAVELYLEMRVK